MFILVSSKFTHFPPHHPDAVDPTKKHSHIAVCAVHDRVSPTVMFGRRTTDEKSSLNFMLLPFTKDWQQLQSDSDFCDVTLVCDD